MKAMVFAAGLGTRLRPLTNECPKALIKVAGKPMLQLVIEHLKEFGFEEIIVNIHYLGNQIREFLQQQNNFGIRIELSDETDEILETGGGLWKARHFFDDGKPFLLCNADILTNMNLNRFYEAHLRDYNLATLAVRDRKSSRYLLFNEEKVLCGWRNKKTNEEIIPGGGDRSNLSELAFSGYHIISPEIFNHCSRSGKFSMIDWYLDICNHQQIKAFQHDDDVWIDIGSAEELQRADTIWKSLIS